MTSSTEWTDEDDRRVAHQVADQRKRDVDLIAAAPTLVGIEQAQRLGAQRFRTVVGSGYTLIVLPDGGDVLFAQTIQDHPPKPQWVGINSYREIEGNDREPGRLVLSVMERWDRHILEELGTSLTPGGSTQDEVTRMLGSRVLEVVKMIRGPEGQVRVVRYHGAVITNVDINGDLPKNVEIMYTRATRHNN